MRLSVAIAGEDALPSAFVVFRGFPESMRQARMLGYDGVELALKRPEELERDFLKSLLHEHQLAVSCISTGQVYGALGYSLTDPDAERRSELLSLYRGFIDLAADFGQMVNIGRIRGPVSGRSRAEVDDLLIEVAAELCSYGAPKGVTLVLEPVNRYELDYINSVDEGVELLRKAAISNLKLMPDLFHMNIEDARIGEALERNISDIAYIHLADSNRHAPGDGHLDFGEVFRAVERAGYQGWFSIEILPSPDPLTAASRAIGFLRTFI